MWAAMAVLGKRVMRWRAILHAAVAALMFAILALPGAPIARAAAAAATLTVTSTWQTGFIARFTVTNMSTAPMSDWRLEFDLPVGESIRHTWSSAITQSGTHYVLTPRTGIVLSHRVVQPREACGAY